MAQVWTKGTPGGTLSWGEGLAGCRPSLDPWPRIEKEIKGLRPEIVWVEIPLDDVGRVTPCQGTSRVANAARTDDTFARPSGKKRLREISVLKGAGSFVVSLKWKPTLLLRNQT